MELPHVRRLGSTDSTEFQNALAHVLGAAVSRVPEGPFEVSDTISLLIAAAHSVAVISGSSPAEAFDQLSRVLEKMKAHAHSTEKQ